MDKVRFRTVFSGTYNGLADTELAGKSAVVEITAEQVTLIAAIMDELEATAHQWNRRLDASDNAVPDEKLLVDADLNIGLPFAVVERPSVLEVEWQEGMLPLEIVPDDAPLEMPRYSPHVSIDAGWQRVYLYAGNGALAQIPIDTLRDHFAAPRAADILVTECIGEPCRVCGRLITPSDLAELEFTGYSKKFVGARAVHGRCMEGFLDMQPDYERGTWQTMADALPKSHVQFLITHGWIDKDGEPMLAGGNLLRAVGIEEYIRWRIRPAEES